MSRSEPSLEQSYQEYLDEITIYGLSVCAECNKSTDAAYECYVSEPVNVVYKCFECAFKGVEDPATLAATWLATQMHRAGR